MLLFFISWVMLLLICMLLSSKFVNNQMEKKSWFVIPPIFCLLYIIGYTTDQFLVIQFGTVLMSTTCGYLIYLLFVRLVPYRPNLFCNMLLVFTFAGSSSMPIWVGDNNLSFVFPIFIVACMLGTRGNKVNRLSMAITFFCMEMSVCAMIDSFLMIKTDVYDILTKVMRVVAFMLIYSILRHKLPQDGIRLSDRLWKLILGLTVMPLSALLSIVVLTYHPMFESPMLEEISWRLGVAVLPFVLITSFVILITVMVLSDHEQLQQAKQLSEMRESYYQNLKQQEKQVRHLRHDMRNHLAAIQGMLVQGRMEQAAEYLHELLESQALQGGKRICQNETANAVLLAKEEAMQQYGLEADFRVELPENLGIAAMDLCALLGNALDNAMEAAQDAEDHHITVQCRCNKGLLMLRVVNAFSGERNNDLRTTKPDKQYHGFGLESMRDIAKRYDGSLETKIVGSSFELTVYLMNTMSI